MITLDLNNNAHAMLLQQMWATMEQAGDIEAGFMSDNHIITQFFELFRPPTQTFISVDEAGIYFAAWFSPFLSAVWQGMWVREDKRQSPSVFKDWISVLNEIFTYVPTVLGLTKRADLLEPHKKLGYDISLVIPEIYEGQAGWLVQLHRNRFKYYKPGEQANG
jgi:hypothetical protein